MPRLVPPPQRALTNMAQAGALSLGDLTAGTTDMNQFAQALTYMAQGFMSAQQEAERLHHQGVQMAYALGQHQPRAQGPRTLPWADPYDAEDYDSDLDQDWEDQVGPPEGVQGSSATEGVPPEGVTASRSAEDVPPEGVTTEGGPASSHAEEETAEDHAGQQGRQHDKDEPRGASKRMWHKQKIKMAMDLLNILTCARKKEICLPSPSCWGGWMS